MPNNTSKIILIGAIIILAFAVAYLSRSHELQTFPKPDTVSPASTTVSTSAEPLPCALSFENIKEGDSVEFPLEIRGTIDNSNASIDCRWVMFEGQAGIAQLYYDNAGLGWDPVGKPEIVRVENWMATSSPFSVTMNYSNQGRGMTSGTKFKIRFNEENPSGEDGQIYDLPVVLK